MKWLRNAVLLLFVFLFIWLFITLFGNESLCLAALCATAILMFTNIPLQLPRLTCYLLFPFLMWLTVIVPYLLQWHYSILLNCAIVCGVTLLVLFLLGPSLSYQSYVPFLFLLALNLNTKITKPVLLSFAAILSGFILAITYSITHNKRKKPPKTLAILRSTFQSHRLFILKLTIGILISYVIGYEIHYVKTSWIILTVISLTQVDFNDTKQKLIDRIKATIIGILIYSFFILLVADQFPQLIPIILIVVTYIYTFVKNYFVKMIFITFNALNAAVASTHVSDLSMMISRLDFIIIGSCITLLIGVVARFIHGTRDSMTQKEVESIRESDNVENIESDENEL